MYSVSPFTLLDYPDRAACIVWFAGCNMRCPYCYNPEIVLGKGKLTWSEVEAFLQKRKGLLQGVVFSGGECTLHPLLPSYARAVKKLGYKLKVDTNGSRPEMLKLLAHEKLLDYVALDFKAPERLFRPVTGSDLFQKFETSLDFLLGAGVPFEVRTTVHGNLLDSRTLHQMQDWLRQKGYTDTYYLQHFNGEKETIQALATSRKPDFSPRGTLWRN